VDLPTYTNIWRIEKRLYKLYDLRLPMPLPLGQIAAFAGITVPYVLFLTLIGMPFNHNLFWLYVLPPWALTWLATRPVLENKRLPELLISQVRYLGEPRVWCRMSAPDEKDEITVTGRVWHARRQPAPQPAIVAAGEAAPARTFVPLRVQARSAQPAAQPAAQSQWAAAAAPAAPRRRAEARHRKSAAARAAAAQSATAQAMPAAAPAMTVQAPSRNGRNGRSGSNGADAPAKTVQWARRGPAPALNARAVSHESRTRERAAGPARPQAGPTSRPQAGPTSRPQAGPTSRPPATRARPASPAARPAAAAAPPASPARRTARPATPPGEGGQRPGWATRARPGTLGGWPVVPSGPGALEVAHAENGQPVRRAPAKPGWEPKRPGWDPRQPATSGSPGTPTRNSAGPNGTAPNGAVPNGAPANGTSANSAAPNGSAANGTATNGTTTNGTTTNGTTTNGAAPNVNAPNGASPGGTAPNGTASAVPEHVVERSHAPRPAQPAAPGSFTPSGPAPSVAPPPSAPTPPAGQAPPAVRVSSPPPPMVPAEARRAVTPRHAGPPSGPATPPAGTPGGYRPLPSPTHGDQEERDQARVRLPLPGPQRIVIIGCTSGAGQTVTALLTARMLASLRAEPVGALDLNPGEGSLAQWLGTAPAGNVGDLLGGTLPAPPPPGVEVISADEPGQHDFGQIGERLAARYRISLIDPGASGVGPALAIADQLVLVAPASGDAPRAVSMTRNWLESHGHRNLAASAVLVVNGVSSRSLPHVEEAEAIVVGRCRAIVRVPWEDQLGSGASPGTAATALRRQARQAITELAGVLVSGLAAGPGDER
jgi:MinD-like ATPase involved in chromosome partitioning or flagellar assembly